MAANNLATALALAALDDSAVKALEERVDDLSDVGFEPLVVDALPTTGMNTHTLYLIQNTEGQDTYYNEYLWFENDGWRFMGTTNINLSNKEDKTNKTTVINSSSTDAQYPSARSVYNLPTTYPGFDATKTQVLKNVNGVLTWVDESDSMIFCVKDED